VTGGARTGPDDSEEAMAAPFQTFTSKVVPLLVDNIDTDQIIPARFLKVIDKRGLADGLFSDWRYDAAGDPRPEFVLNQPGMRDRRVLLAGDNFGAGSSREHAPWALTGFGFRAVVSTSFADIFRNNSLKNGLLPIVVDKATHASLAERVETDPDLEVAVDLQAQELRVHGGDTVAFEIDPFMRSMLLDGTDELGYLLGLAEDVAAYEAAHPPRFDATRPPVPA
jgi:3-isopropylmalate/(R)-2-methylmalate dehydratase small subunit